MEPIFTRKNDDYIYTSNTDIDFDSQDDIYLPLEVDTEFYQPAYQPGVKTTPNTTITVQYRSIFQSNGIIYAHPDIAGYSPRHTLITHPCSAGNYLEDMGYSIKMYRETDTSILESMPTLNLDLYTFFAVAELYRIFDGIYIADIDYLCTTKDKYGIDQARRLRTFTKHGSHYLDYVLLPWVWSLAGRNYRVALRILDTSAVHGIANYSAFCANSGVSLKFKDNFRQEC